MIEKPRIRIAAGMYYVSWGDYTVRDRSCVVAYDALLGKIALLMWCSFPWVWTPEDRAKLALWRVNAKLRRFP